LKSQGNKVEINNFKLLIFALSNFKIKMKPNTQQLHDLTTQVRRDILRMVHAVNSGHPGGSLGCTEFLVCLYQNLMDRNEGFDMDGINEDVFFLSNGHISPVFYSVLARSGYFPVAELATFRLLDSRLQGHPTTHEGLPGVRSIWFTWTRTICCSWCCSS